MDATLSPICTPIYIRFEKGFGQNTFKPWHTKHYRFTTKLCYFKFIYILFVYLPWILILYVTNLCTHICIYRMCGIFALNCNFKWVFSLNHNKPDKLFGLFYVQIFMNLNATYVVNVKCITLKIIIAFVSDWNCDFVC